MGIRLTWYGHACWLIQGEKVRLLIDPFITDNPQAKVSADELDADYILISHGHFDHVADAAAIAKRSNATIISNLEIVNWFKTNHETEGHALQMGGGFNFPFGRVQLTTATHGSTMPDGSTGGNPAGFLITLEGKLIYNSGDTGLTSDMKLIGERHKVDLAILPIGDNYTMGPEDALYAVGLIKPKLVIPNHYSTWPLIDQDPQAWAEKVKAETTSDCIVLMPGEDFELAD